LERAHVVCDIHVVRRVEFPHHATHPAEILCQAPVGGRVAQQALPSMPVGVDETRHDDHVSTVDLAAVDRSDIWSDRGNLLALDKHIGVEMLADGWVHRQNNSVSDNRPLHLRFLFRLLATLESQLFYSADFPVLAFNSTASER